MELNKLSFIFSLFIFISNLQNYYCKSSLTFSNFLSLSNQHCEYKLSNGKYYNLLPLRRGLDFTLKYKKYIYQANFCGSLVTNNCAPDLNTPAAVYLRTGLCLERLTYEWEPVVTFLNEPNPNAGLKLVLPPGQSCVFKKNAKWQVTYILNCDENEEAKFTTFSVNLCKVNFVFNTKYGCESNAKLNDNEQQYGFFNSIKIIFLFLFLFVVYCIVFSYLNYQNNPEDGIIKAIPNRTFWKCFCESVARGFSYTYELIKTTIKKCIN